MQLFDVSRYADPPLIPSLRKYEKLREALVDEVLSKGPGTREEAHVLLDEVLSLKGYIVTDGSESDAEKSWWVGRTCVEFLDANGADGWSKRQFAGWLDTGVDELFKSWKSKEGIPQ